MEYTVERSSMATVVLDDGLSPEQVEQAVKALAESAFSDTLVTVTDSELKEVVSWTVNPA